MILIFQKDDFQNGELPAITENFRTTLEPLKRNAVDIADYVFLHDGDILRAVKNRETGELFETSFKELNQKTWA